MEYVLKHEGGYVDHPKDPGGATNMGITLATLRDWRERPVSKANVKALSRSEAMEIYRALYWNTVKGDDLPAGVDYAVLDFAINSGPDRAARYLQRIVGATQDGRIGPITLALTKRMDAAEVINALCDARLAYLKGLKTWDTFGKGWERRVREVREHALEMVEPPSLLTDIPPALPIEARLEALERRVAALEASQSPIEGRRRWA
jgi:lysozyme family protein